MCRPIIMQIIRDGFEMNHMGSDPISEDARRVMIIVPEMSGECAYELVRRTYSILRKDGKVIIAIKQKNINSNRMGVMDTFYLHDYTIREKCLKNKSMLRKIVLFIEPIRSIKMLTHKQIKGFSEIVWMSSINEFCKERSIQLVVYQK